MNSFSALLLISQVANWQRVQNPNYSLWYRKEKEPSSTFGSQVLRDTWEKSKMAFLLNKSGVEERREGFYICFSVFDQRILGSRAINYHYSCL